MVTMDSLTVFDDMASWDDLYSAAYLEPPDLDHAITHMYVLPPLTILPVR